MIKYGVIASMLLIIGSTPASAGRPAPYQCIVNDLGPQPCLMRFTTSARGMRTVDMTIGKIRYSFTGRARDGWWSGRLNGKPAMGYELNQANVKFATSDLSLRIQYYYEGREHGNY